MPYLGFASIPLMPGQKVTITILASRRFTVRHVIQIRALVRRGKSRRWAEEVQGGVTL